MNLVCSDLPDGVRKIDLIGRMDIDGTNAVDLRLISLVATNKYDVIVDLSALEFIASLGLSVLVQAAKTASLRGGSLALLKPRPNVRKVLVSTRIAERIPVYEELEQARAALPSLAHR